MVLYGIVYVVLYGIAWYFKVLATQFMLVFEITVWYCMGLYGIGWYCTVMHGIEWD